MAQLTRLLLTLVILVASSFPVLSAVTIGLEGVMRVLVPEAIGNKLLCASVMGNSSSQYAANIDIVYQDRGAYGKMDLTGIHVVQKYVKMKLYTDTHCKPKVCSLHQIKV